MKEKNLPVRGIILNHYTDSPMEQDNIRMIEERTGLSVVATVRDGDTTLEADAVQLQRLVALYGEGGAR